MSSLASISLPHGSSEVELNDRLPAEVRTLVLAIFFVSLACFANAYNLLSRPHLATMRVLRGSLFSIFVLIVLAEIMRSTRIGELLKRRNLGRDEDRPRVFREWKLVIVVIAFF